MVDSAQFRPDNWLNDLHHGCYCIVSEVSQGAVLVKRFPEFLYEPILSQLDGITILRDNLTLAQFAPGEGNFHERKVRGTHLMIVPMENGSFGWYVNGKLVKRIRYMHELQNAFEDSTGQLLELNLYGAKH